MGACFAVPEEPQSVATGTLLERKQCYQKCTVLHSGPEMVPKRSQVTPPDESKISFPTRNVVNNRMDATSAFFYICSSAASIA